MALVSPELSLDLRPSFVPETISVLLKQVSLIDDVNEKLKKVDEFIERLEDEMKKIRVFERELPLCMLILQDAISVLKQESRKYKKMKDGGEPVLEEFIPLKKEPGCEENPIKSDENNKGDGEDSSRDKKNWLSSVQLWNADNVPTKTAYIKNNNQNHNLNQIHVSQFQKGEDKRDNVVGDDDLYDSIKHREGSKGVGPMFHTYPSFTEIRRITNKEDVSLSGLSMLIPAIKHPKQDSISSGSGSKFGASRMSSSVSPISSGHTYIRPGHQQPTSRKQRRCWSPELHRRFVDALNQLGGPQVATPKQIRELMRVDGLTNDEVKSHLQKYRLHTRRVPKTSPKTSSTSTNEIVNTYATTWPTQDQLSESSRPGSSQSGSPQGPLQFSSMDEDDDEKSESYSWKGQVDRPGKDDV